MNAQPFARSPRRRSALLIAALLAPLAGLVGSAHADNGPAVYQTANFTTFMQPDMVQGGAATLLRYKQNVTARVAASGLDANSAYSVWWVVFNNPAACVDGCNGPDLGNPAVQAAVFYAAGLVTGADGTANLDAYLSSGALPIGTFYVGGTAEGLTEGNGFGAEIHLVLHSHGAIKPGDVASQISTFDGGCNPTCVSQQAAVFAPAL